MLDATWATFTDALGETTAEDGMEEDADGG